MNDSKLAAKKRSLMPSSSRRHSLAIAKQLYITELKRMPTAASGKTADNDSVDDIDICGDEELTAPSANILRRMTARRRMTSTGFNESTLTRTFHLIDFNRLERKFIEAVERGDRHAVEEMLRNYVEEPFNVNCRDHIGRTALEIAVDNENVDIVKLLINADKIRIGNALLHAVHEDSYKIVEILIEHPQITPAVLGCDWARYRGSGDSFYNYPSYISPIVLAAQRNAFEILQLFLSRGAIIKKPHVVTCGCINCADERAFDSLRFSLKRINIYSALASPAWICLTSRDPVLTAFKLSHKLEVLANVENEFRDAYVKMSSQCKTFVCDLLDECRSTEEVSAVLALDSTEPEPPPTNNKGSTYNHYYIGDDDNFRRCDFSTRSGSISGRISWQNGSNFKFKKGRNDAWDELSLERLKLAIKYKQKQFVTHPHCQQVLANLWYGDVIRWRQLRFSVKTMLCLVLITTFPLAALIYLCAPKSKIGRIICSPFMKFLYHSTSFGIFLALLVLAGSEHMYEDGRADTRGPAPSPFEWLVYLYVLGFIWNESKQVYSSGLKTYIKEWWNWLDFTMIALYLSSIMLRSVAYFQIENSPDLYGPRKLTRSEWPANDPTLVSEALFAIANVFSFARIVFLFQANPHLGPLQISLGCMIIDISKFLLIFFLILTSFACGLNQLYWFYADTIDEQVLGTRPVLDAAETARTYTTLLRSYLNLFWSLFGHTNVLTLAVPGSHMVVEVVGELLLLAYHAMAIIVLLNMLIAMMSNSFQNITANSDIEWKFARTKLWMSYFDKGNTLPPPFNIIISPKSIYYVVRKIWQTLCQIFCPMGFSKFNPPSGHGISSTIDEMKKRTNVPRYKKTEFRQFGQVAGHKVNNQLRMFANNDTNAEEGYQNRQNLLESITPEMPNKFKTNKKNGRLVISPTENSSRQEIIQRLVGRYMVVMKKRLRQQDVNADDLLEIKQDISSLRFEMKDYSRRDNVVQKQALQQLKNELLRSLLHSNSTLKVAAAPTIRRRGSVSRRSSFNSSISRHKRRAKVASEGSTVDNYEESELSIPVPTLETVERKRLQSFDLKRSNADENADHLSQALLTHRSSRRPTLANIVRKMNYNDHNSSSQDTAPSTSLALTSSCSQRNSTAVSFESSSGISSSPRLMRAPNLAADLLLRKNLSDVVRQELITFFSNISATDGDGNKNINANFNQIISQLASRATSPIPRQISSMQIKDETESSARAAAAVASKRAVPNWNRSFTCSENLSQLAFVTTASATVTTCPVTYSFNDAAEVATQVTASMDGTTTVATTGRQSFRVPLTRTRRLDNNDTKEDDQIYQV